MRGDEGKNHVGKSALILIEFERCVPCWCMGKKQLRVSNAYIHIERPRMLDACVCCANIEIDGFLQLTCSARTNLIVYGLTGILPVVFAVEVT